MNKIRLIALIVGWLSVAWGVSAQTASVTGAIHDETGGALPGVSIELRGGPGTPIVAVTDNQGTYRFDGLAAGRYEVSVTLPNFAAAHREVTVSPTGTSRVDLVLHLALSADVTVTGKGTFTNLADAQNPAANLVGIAQSASQGAITAKQLEARPTMRSGEVLETVPGVIISQHSGEAKANQYYLRGFNLDHGTDLATSVAGMPVNMPTHGHGQGYTDLNFMIPELISRMQYKKGTYYAEEGDFSAAMSRGTENCPGVNSLSWAIKYRLFVMFSMSN